MKILFLILFFTISQLSSQSLQITYLNKNSKYTIFQEDLFIINKNNYISIRDSLVNNSFDKNNAYDAKKNESIYFTKEKLHRIIYFKNKEDSNKLIFKDYIGENYYYVEDTFPQIIWNTDYSETKTIIGYECKKATSQFRGSKLIAYYTSKLPYNTGPFKFGGLNGLILKIFEENNEDSNSWVVTSIKTTDMKNSKIPTLPKKMNTLSIKEFIELKDIKRDEDFQKIIKNVPSETTIIRHKIKRNGIEKTYEWEN